LTSRPHPPGDDPADIHLALPGVIREFSDRYGQRLHDPLFARERCEPVSRQFAAACQARGIPAAVISGVRTGEHPAFPGVELILDGHFAVLLPSRRDTAEHDGGPEDGLVIDWTARQFDPAAPVPAITTAAAWREDWPALGSSRAGGPAAAPGPPAGLRSTKPPRTRQAARSPRQRP
jgi:hypothetical protein